MKSFEFVENCPIEVTLKIIGKKWALPIIRDLFRGKSRFKDFLKENPQISSKMLSVRLKDLQNYGIIEKKVISATPLMIEYSLTKKGTELNRILYFLAIYSLKNFSEDVYSKVPNSFAKDINFLKESFNISN